MVIHFRVRYGAQTFMARDAQTFMAQDISIHVYYGIRERYV